MKSIIMVLGIFSAVFLAVSSGAETAESSPYSQRKESKDKTEGGSPVCEEGDVCPQNVVGGSTEVRFGINDETNQSPKVRKFLPDKDKPGSGTGTAIQEGKGK